VPERIEIAPGVTIDRAEIELRASRSSGPGGQHANVTASRIEARFDVFESQSLSDEQKRRIAGRLGPVVTAVAQDTRSQMRNRELAIERVASRLGGALRRRRPRRATKPSRAAKQRRLEAKRKTGQRKADRRKPRQGDWD
jgi:ribosome-associated protein